jgi:hypothetical protein
MSAYMYIILQAQTDGADVYLSEGLCRADGFEKIRFTAYSARSGAYWGSCRQAACAGSAALLQAGELATAAAADPSNVYAPLRNTRVHTDAR